MRNVIKFKKDGTVVGAYSYDESGAVFIVDGDDPEVVRVEYEEGQESVKAPDGSTVSISLLSQVLGRDEVYRIRNGEPVVNQEATERRKAEEQAIRDRFAKQDELASMDAYFQWYGTQAVQHESGTLSDADFARLKAEYVEKSKRAKELKESLGLSTETEARKASR